MTTLTEPAHACPRPPKPKPLNPIETALQTWLELYPSTFQESISSSITSEVEFPSTPKRWVVYPPMVLLAPGSFDQKWWSQISPPILHDHRDELYHLILSHIGKREGKGELTHLAANAGIPAQENSESSRENILRSPSNLVTLYGDFGPLLPLGREPSEKDFAEAFWVSTKQNGITQIWAPRYTMFSRGNVKEKARLLGFHDLSKKEDGLKSRELSKSEVGKSIAVDLYAGIGYFVFSYVAMGCRRVFGWELNPWSVEGLRRGSVANGWSVRIIKQGQEVVDVNENIVVYLEDNQKAGERLRGLEIVIEGRVKHVNCGLLPNSTDSWKTALEILSGEGWLHLHENVGVKDIETRRKEIEGIFETWLQEAKGQRLVKVEHVELVKTFAPGVLHCVFDVYISKDLSLRRKPMS